MAAPHDNAHPLDLGDAAPAAAPPPPLTDDYARHLRAEAIWQSRRAAARLWGEVVRCVALGR